MTLPANIAERIDDLTLAQAACTWAEASTFTLRSEKDARAKDAREARQALVSAIDELAAERDRYRDALVARHGGEPLALLSELDAARAERDAAISQASSLTGRLDGALEVQRKLRAERCAQGRAS